MNIQEKLILNRTIKISQNPIRTYKKIIVLSYNDHMISSCLGKHI